MQTHRSSVLLPGFASFGTDTLNGPSFVKMQQQQQQHHRQQQQQQQHARADTFLRVRGSAVPSSLSQRRHAIATRHETASAFLNVEIIETF